MSFLNKFMRFYFTVRPLRLEQIWYRLYYKSFPLRRLSKATSSFSSGSWVWNGPEITEPSYLGDSTYRFLNVEGTIHSFKDWNNPKFEKLWLYNLHYFNDLNARGNLSRKDQLIEQVLKWIQDNPPVVGNGWEPYPLSLRIVNLIKWYDRISVNDQRIVDSISQQTEALSKQLEYHILGNHLFANAKALVFSGCFLSGSTSTSFLELGLNILERELPEQFLPDGGHFELSPMYHCILLWDLLELIQLAKITKNQLLIDNIDYWNAIAHKGLNWLETMTHPDGDISFFNDSAFGIAPSPSELFSFASLLGVEQPNKCSCKLQTLVESGYSSVDLSHHRLIFDHAAIGPDYLPGHGHADTLSFEWSVGKQRVFVNSGTSVYGNSKERLRQRKTAAHNTVVVEGADSSEVWSGFRVARRATSKLEFSEIQDDSVVLIASHNGYERLQGKINHRRKIIAKNDILTVKDQLIGNYNSAYAHFHLHPDILATKLSNNTISLKLLDGTALEFCSSNPCELVRSSWHSHFGESLTANKILVQFEGSELTSSITILTV